jgi:two-component system, NtrC family, nitrogen regulation sensor histidine kinase NtrY
LPPPTFGRVSIQALATRVARLEQRLPARIEGGPDASVRGDPDQLDQALINLVKNAVDASLESGSAEVAIAWSLVGDGDSVEISVRDRGPGVADAASLFVPFFTTKPGGAGIGLALTREIVDAHRGRVSIENRADGPGACALVRLPV